MNDHRNYIRNLTNAKRMPGKFRPERGRTHDLRDAGAVLLPTELSSQLGADHIVSS